MSFLFNNFEPIPHRTHKATSLFKFRGWYSEAADVQRKVLITQTNILSSFFQLTASPVSIHSFLSQTTLLCCRGCHYLSGCLMSRHKRSCAHVEFMITKKTSVVSEGIDGMLVRHQVTVASQLRHSSSRSFRRCPNLLWVSVCYTRNKV